jgi:hypothetical protein
MYQQLVGGPSTIKLPARELSVSVANRISSKTGASKGILSQRSSNSLKRFAGSELTRNRVFDDEYRSADLAAAG